MVQNKRFGFEMNGYEPDTQMQNYDGPTLLREIYSAMKSMESHQKYIKDGLQECKQRINELEKECRKLKNSL
jgi:polyhydroxyalkanoate synthesis regulator phasin